MAYAENTSVPVDRSKAEIERILQRYGADQFISGWDCNRAMIGFRMNGRQIRFIVELPDKGGKEFTHTPGRRNKRDEVFPIVKACVSCKFDDCFFSDALPQKNGHIPCTDPKTEHPSDFV